MPKQVQKGVKKTMISTTILAQKTAEIALSIGAYKTAETMLEIADNLQARDGFIQAVAMGTIDLDGTSPNSAMNSFMTAWNSKTETDDIWSVWDGIGN
jgi:hypothetical protein